MAQEHWTKCIYTLFYESIVLTAGEKLGSYQGGTDCDESKEAFLSLKGSSRVADRRVAVEIFFDESRDGAKGCHEQYGNDNGNPHFAKETEASDRRDPFKYNIGATKSEGSDTFLQKGYNKEPVGFLEVISGGFLLFNKYWRPHSRLLWKRLRVR